LFLSRLLCTCFFWLFWEWKKTVACVISIKTLVNCLQHVGDSVRVVGFNSNYMCLSSALRYVVTMCAVTMMMMMKDEQTLAWR